MSVPPYHPFRSAAAQAVYYAHDAQASQRWPVPTETTMVETTYGQTFVRISGPVDAPPLVLLPGAGSCSRMWTFTIAPLAQHYRTYALDSLIHTGCLGRSIPTRAIATATDATSWLDQLIDGLRLTTGIHLLGASFGGWLASQYALQFQQRLATMALIAPAGTIMPFQKTYLQRTILTSLIPFRWMQQRFFRWCCADLARQAPAVLEAMVDEAMLCKRCFVPPHYKHLPTLTAMTDHELQHLTIPIAVFVGENEVLYSAHAALRRLRQVAPQIHAEIIPHAGHDLLLAQKAIVNQKLVTFFRTALGRAVQETTTRE
ncbi:carboxylesterase NA (plasmid) [Herpetosiphon aurantiacus DSM 785]|uniref:Carboxylesterase NA n=1 Tax=Herpetosiphon aurantiacus (strain ATCC 23779 / DSM 785 / 114-95) TaxID=316274 RepID=A9B8H9_HERA2|nr:carboxylesterase NA [Herpetosiphon aurantiacus DSM 785]